MTEEQKRPEAERLTEAVSVLETQLRSIAQDLAELHRKHGEIEREIDEALTHPSATDLEIAELKRRKLAIKDEIYKIRAEPTRH